MSKRMTKGELQESLGAFNPVGHAVLAFADDKAAGEAAKAVRDSGFGAEDVLVFTSAELLPDLANLMRNASASRARGLICDTCARTSTRHPSSGRAVKKT